MPFVETSRWCAASITLIVLPTAYNLRTFTTFSIPHPHNLTRLSRPRFSSTQAHAQEGLTELKSLFELNKLKPHVNRTFSLDDIAQAFMLSAGHGEGGVSNHLGKIAINIAKT